MDLPSLACHASSEHDYMALVHPACSAGQWGTNVRVGMLARANGARNLDLRFPIDLESLGVANILSANAT